MSNGVSEYFMIAVSILSALGGLSGLAGWYRARAALVEARAAAKRSEVDALQEALGTVTAENRRMCTRIEELEADKTRLTRRVDDLAQDARRWETEARELRRQLAEAKRCQAELEVKVQLLEAEKARREAALAALDGAQPGQDGSQ
jgi:chromosome segregation ATPase